MKECGRTCLFVLIQNVDLVDCCDDEVVLMRGQHVVAH